MDSLSVAETFMCKRKIFRHNLKTEETATFRFSTNSYGPRSQKRIKDKIAVIAGIPQDLFNQVKRKFCRRLLFSFPVFPVNYQTSSG